MTATRPEAELRSFITAVGYACGLTMVAAIVAYGFPKDRWIGGIHPNVASFLVLIFASVSWSKRTKIGYAAAVAAFAMALVLSSRYVLLIMLFVAMLDVVARAYRGRRLTFSAVVIPFLIPAAFAALSRQLAKVFLLDDRARGVDAGFSGRTELDTKALADIPNHPLLGVGFRNKAGHFGGHNGYIAFINENGLIISTLFFAALAIILVTALRRLLGQSSFNDRVMGQLFVGTSIAAMAQPQLVNFGDGQGIAFFLSFTYFLVSPSPAYRAKREAARRAAYLSAQRGVSLAPSGAKPQLVFSSPGAPSVQAPDTEH